MRYREKSINVEKAIKYVLHNKPLQERGGYSKPPYKQITESAIKFGLTEKFLMTILNVQPIGDD